ncbi:hypothetical protein ES703_46940 [subsurface metagenome]
MSENNLESDSNLPLIPDITREHTLTPTTNEESRIVAENDPNDHHLVITDKNGDVDKDHTMSQVELSDEYERIIGRRHLDYLDELGKTFHIVPVYEKKVKIIIKRNE